MKVKLTEQQFRRVILKEQHTQPGGRPDFVKELYKKVVKASKYWGTDPDAIADAIRRLKDIGEVSDFMSMFKDKKTGYLTFNEMVNGEYDQWNLPSIQKLKNSLEKWGKVEYRYGTKPIIGTPVFTQGSFKFTFYHPLTFGIKGKECATKFKKLLPVGVKWWSNWLNSPITQEKFKNNNQLTKEATSEIFSKYKDELKKANIIPYYKEAPSAYAYVNPSNPGNIFVNCYWARNKNESLSDLIHELQHSLHDVHPLNPDKQIGDLFIRPNTITMTPKIVEQYWDDLGRYKFKSEKIDPTNKIDQDYDEGDLKDIMGVIEWREIVGEVAQKLKMSGDEVIISDKLIYWYESMKNKTDDPGYVCRATEKGSNVSAMRQLFNLSPTDKLSIEMLKPYILKKKHDTDVMWLLMCWAKNGFADLKEFTDKFNELADKIEINGEEDSPYDTMT